MSKSATPKAIGVITKVNFPSYSATFILGEDVSVGDLLFMGKGGKLRKVTRRAKNGEQFGYAMKSAKAGDTIELNFRIG